MDRREQPRPTLSQTLMGLLLVIILAVGCAAGAPSPGSPVAPGSYQVVGTGPGDADLLTPRALSAIARADIVFCEPRLQEQLEALVPFDGKRVLAGYGVIFPYYGRDCATVPADQPSRWSMSCEQFQEKQAGFVARVRAAVAAGKHVVMLSGGDPTIYGPAMWSLHALADLNPTVVPGISAFNAANAALQVRLGEVVLTAPFQRPNRKDTLENFADNDQATLVIFMPGDMPAMLERLAAAYPAGTPAAVVVRAGHVDREKVITGTLADIGDRLDPADANMSLFYLGRSLTTARHPSEPTANVSDGKYYLLGMGPGDADLASLRALAVIEKADLIFAQQRLQERFAAHLEGKTVMDGYHRLFPFYGRDCAEVTAAERAQERMSCEQYQAKQAEFAALVRAAVAEGKIVAMLDSGDPMIYGPNAWTLAELSDLRKEVVPGLSALNAGNAALAGGVTEGKSSHSVILASRWSVERMAAYQATMVLFTMRAEFKTFIDALAKHYPPHTPVAIVQSAGFVEREKVIRGRLDTILAEVDTGRIPFEYLLYVGDFLEGRSQW
jgi:precorrin-4 methylase